MKLSRRGFLGGLSALLTVKAISTPIVEKVVECVEDPLILPYRGKTVIDAGLFYCPYVPLQMTSVSDAVVEKIGFKTRYGLVANPFKQKAA